MKVTQISLSVELDGKCYIAVIPNDKFEILLCLAGTLFEDGKVPLIAAPSDFHFEPFMPQTD